MQTCHKVNFLATSSALQKHLVFGHDRCAFPRPAAFLGQAQNLSTDVQTAPKSGKSLAVTAACCSSPRCGANGDIARLRPIDRTASSTGIPCAVSTSTWRSLATIFSGLCISSPIPGPHQAKKHTPVGPLHWGGSVSAVAILLSAACQSENGTRQRVCSPKLCCLAHWRPCQSRCRTKQIFG